MSRAPFICDRCKRHADVLYVQRGALCGPCAYPEAYRTAAERQAHLERAAAAAVARNFPRGFFAEPDSAFSQLSFGDAVQLGLPL